MVPSENKGTLDAWEANADFWDQTMGSEGNKYWQQLQIPCLNRIIAVDPSTKVLELATGNGLGARLLASRGASVLATDGSEKMVKLAAQRTPPDLLNKIEYRPLDATKSSAFDELLRDPEASNGFDVVLINMAIMDIETLDPIAEALPKLLKKGGSFVATTLHPVFFTTNAASNTSQVSDPETGRSRVIRTKLIEKYLHVPPWRGTAFNDQPKWQLYFHRPLHELLGIFFKQGLVMDALEEPTFSEQQATSCKSSVHTDFSQIPVLMALRFRKIG
ncbi:hypothetical protein jhhlp_008834 [Lomentospora prolificans]|uniref:Methyltransferase type 11 domain-containing protein n=1 Tax=Lomentospora prolificans TaxID=41688 RepID=A0A2N3MZ54_9PEZI|nr:hypothetical protein jhhlp_008834 [Lomentospora prolificans]